MLIEITDDFSLQVEMAKDFSFQVEITEDSSFSGCDHRGLYFFMFT